ncbi:MAG: tetratricopeptide repeat protein [Fulvivirga sp.]|uniref:tetratricopeptide repeat protein n=1 Tax=Fulvivirga sp. TaxID=1931237 RepID=UPI0032ED74D6
MNKQKFNNVVAEPESITLSDAKDLSSLAKTYPYSQIIHALVAKGYSGRNEKQYKTAVATAAMYATDRQVLKELVVKRKPTAPVELKPAPQQEKLKENTKENTAKRKVDIDVSSFNTDSELLRNNLWSDLELLKASKASYLEHFKDIDDTKSTSKTSKAASTGNKAKKSNPKTATAKNVKTESKNKPAPDAKTSSKKKIATAKKTTATTRKTAVTKPAAKAKSTKKEPGKGTSATKTTSSVDNKKDNPTKETTKKKSVSSVKKKDEKPSLAKTSIKEQIKIIDSFIDKEPSISSKPVKTVTGDQKDLSEKSTSFGDDLLSENLAQILVEQGKTQKAIDMYKKLIWKFPQKKTYFAARIEELTK